MNLGEWVLSRPFDGRFCARGRGVLRLLLSLPPEVRPPVRQEAVPHHLRHRVWVRLVELLGELEQE
jgi:hypothetical protein